MKASAERAAVARRWAPLAAVGAILVFHSLRYAFVTDDAYISFVYSRHLAEIGELTFNPGRPPVEGYTNFLWTFVLGLLYAVGLPPEVASLWLSAACALATLALIAAASARLWGERSLWDVLAPALLALSAGYACWTSGGLETQLFTFLTTAAIVAFVVGDSEPRWLRRSGFFLAAAAMTRPEGLLIAGLLGASRLLLAILRDRRLRPSRAELACAGYFLALWAPWFAWRWSYYGHLFPNTYYVKAAGPASAEYRSAIVEGGLYYVWQWARTSGALAASPLIAIGWWAAPRKSGRFLFGAIASLVTAVYLAYTVRVGGDFMGLHRFVMPLFVLAALGCSFGLRTVVERLAGSGRSRRAVGAVAAAVLLSLHGATQLALTERSRPKWRACAPGDRSCLARLGRPFWPADRGIDTPSYLALYAHDRARIGWHMRECFAESDFSIFGGVGAKPYLSGARGIDVFGLVSERIAHEVPRTRPRPGHNKWAPDAALVDWYHPDFVFHCYSLAEAPGSPQWNCDPSSWRRRGYAPVTLRIPGLLERGEYYSFWVAAERLESFVSSCPGAAP